jgi:hypothetical protein
VDNRGHGDLEPDPTVRYVVWVLVFFCGVLGLVIGTALVVLIALW